MDSLPKGIGDLYVLGSLFGSIGWSQVDSLPKGIGDICQLYVFPVFHIVPSGLTAERHESAPRVRDALPERTFAEKGPCH